MSYSKKGKQEKNRKKRKKIFGHAEEVLTQLETVNKQEQKQDKNGSTIKPGVSPEKQRPNAGALIKMLHDQKVEEGGTQLVSVKQSRSFQGENVVYGHNNKVSVYNFGEVHYHCRDGTDSQ
eukprot:m.145349 g.145349  ORF g.145349 m.145349 type:complete len:121 (+) comp38420_c0_seq4:1309-1671(+)